MFHAQEDPCPALRDLRFCDMPGVVFVNRVDGTAE